MPLEELTGELQPGSFWSTVRNRSNEALRAGALHPISTKADFVEDGGIEFVVRVSDNLLRKREAPGSYHAPRRDNPFLPPEPGLTIGSLAPHHVAVLNKFNVIEDHVLVVTRGFAHQESPLTADDFAAVAPGLAEGAGLAFYNAGRTAGASQPHKHFQLVPLPLGRRAAVPTAVLFDGAADGVQTVARLGFRHAFSRVETPVAEPEAFGRACHDLYRRALAGLGLIEAPHGEEESRLPPYNLLLTERWMFIAPRRAEHYRDVSVNALGYAGSLLVSSPDKLDYVRATGPLTILDSVSIAAS